MEENSVNNRMRGLKPFKPGESGNPNGRPKGKRNFSTIFYDALENLAEKNNMDALSLETEIVEKALLSARKGDARFYKDLMDRVHGQATQKTDVTSGGAPLTVQIINYGDSPDTTQLPESNGVSA